MLNLNAKSLLNVTNGLLNTVRNASKKTGGSTRNPIDPHGRPKHRGWKRQDGSYVSRGTILVTQTKPRFFPGLYCGWGQNGTLFARVNGKVYVTCEKTDMNFKRPWIQRFFAEREGQTIYKKYFNVIPFPQHQRFRLVDQN